MLENILDHTDRTYKMWMLRSKQCMKEMTGDLTRAERGNRTAPLIIQNSVCQWISHLVYRCQKQANKISENQTSRECISGTSSEWIFSTQERKGMFSTHAGHSVSIFWPLPYPRPLSPLKGHGENRPHQSMRQNDPQCGSGSQPVPQHWCGPT